ncbi:hypothetical protein BC629DRAFT_1288020 [Irpex lacteus]|nr:hypothetical protein BC629DRAFT_1288020 [Irpex lacteus]
MTDNLDSLTGRVGIYTTNTGTSTPVKRDDATFVGYLGAYGVTTESDSSLASGPWVYTYTVPASSSQPVNLDHSGTPYRLSAVAIRSGPQVTLGPGNSVYLEAENTRANTPAGSATSTYVYDTYAIGYAQTAVWILDSATGLVTCQWVNPDGSRPRVYSVKSGSGLYLTGDIAALRSQLGNPSDFTQVVSATPRLPDYHS